MPIKVFKKSNLIFTCFCFAILSMLLLNTSVKANDMDEDDDGIIILREKNYDDVIKENNIIFANMKKKPEKQKYEFVTITLFADKAGLPREAPRYWIKKGVDNKGRKLQYRIEFGRIFISTYHLT